MSGGGVHSLQFQRRIAYEGGIPLILVFLGEAHVLAIIDTGSECSFLLDIWASVAGVKLDDGQPVDVYGVRESGITPAIGRLHHIPVSIYKEGVPRCPVVFIAEHPYTRYGIDMILGRKEVFEKIGPVAFEESPEGNFIYISE